MWLIDIQKWSQSNCATSAPGGCLSDYHSHGSDRGIFLWSCVAAFFFSQQHECLYTGNYFRFQMQVLSNSLTSTLVTTMWIHFHPYFKSRTVSDCSSVFKSQLEWFCPSQDKARNQPQVHQPSSSSPVNSVSAPSFKEDPVTLPFRRFSGIQPSFCPFLESKC